MPLKFSCPVCENEIISKSEERNVSVKCPYCSAEPSIPNSAEKTNEEPNEHLKLTQEDKIKPTPESFFIENEKFPAVKNFSRVIKIVSWIVFACLIIIGVVDFIMLEFRSGIINIVAGSLFLIINLGIAELSLVLLAIEENTRKS